ncbi:MAG: multicopper oxidase domain-containing protein [Candidatus Melainabacteria bacterium]
MPIGWAGTVEYTLTVAREQKTITGKPVTAMTVNGQIPGPLIEATEGDDLEVHVVNTMDEDTSIHWHGILLPNRQDGVSYLTTPPIRAHSTHTFTFPVRQTGTYWYHSHTRLQEQRGVYGPIVFHPKPGEPEAYPPQSLGLPADTPTTAPAVTKIPAADREAVLVLSDWTNEDPQHVLRNLKRGTEWYGVKKKTKQSVVGAFQRHVAWASLKRSFSRMPAMDLSDVAYDAFLINGQQESLGEAKPGETVRLRLINGSASTYFYVNYPDSMTVIATDGLPIKPVQMNKLLIAIAETYDVLVTVPEIGIAELRATPQDGSGKASYWLGTGEQISAPAIPKPNMYVMQHDMHAMRGDMAHNMHGMNHPASDGGSHQAEAPAAPEESAHHHHSPPPTDLSEVTFEPEEARPLAPYYRLRAIQPTTLPPGRPSREYTFHLTGDMTRYIWTINGKTMNESDAIRIRRGETVRFTLINDTMMHHPMHLHGHYFRVITEQRKYSALKHTVDVPPMGQRVIEFAADEEKDWFFHCHVLYHMVTGMHQIVSYEDSEPDADIQAMRHMLYHDPVYAWGTVNALSQMMEGNVTAVNTRNTLQAEWEYDWRDQFDTELTYERYFNRYFQVFGGANLYHENHAPIQARGIAGIRYLLPFMVASTVWVDSDGDFRVSARKEIPVTQRLSLFGRFEYDTASRFEWLAGGSFILTQALSVYGQYHSDYSAGAGIQVRF